MADIDLDLGLNTDEAREALKDFAQAAGRFADTYEKELTDASDEVSKTLQDNAKKTGGILDKEFNGIAIAAGVAVAAFAGFKVIQDVTAAASAQQDAINRLNTSLKNAGDFSLAASEDFQSFASQLQQVTTVGDETTLELAALARNFTQTNDQAKQLTEAAIQLSAATGIELESAVRNLGKTFGGLTGELGESVPELRNLSKEALQSGAAIGFVLERFGGSAQAELQTFSGITQAIANNFGDLREEVGFAIIENEALIIVLNKLNQIFIDLGGSVKENRDVLSDFVTGTIKFFVDSIGVAVGAIQSLVDGYFALIAATKTVNIAFAEFGRFIVTGFIDTVQSAFELFFIDTIKGFREFVVGIADLLREIPGFDNLFPEFSTFIDEEIGAVQKSFERVGKSISIASSEAGAYFDEYIKGQADVIIANEESRASIQGFTDSIIDGAAEASFEISNISDDVSKAAKQVETAGKKIGASIEKPIKEAADKSKESISGFLDEFSRQQLPLEQQIQEVGRAVTEAYNADNVDDFKKSFTELTRLQAEYTKAIEETAKAQEDAARKAADAQSQQIQDLTTGIASAVLGADATSAQTINDLESDVNRLRDNLNTAGISEDKRLEIQEEILKKEEEIAKAREAQQKSTAGVVAQVGGLVTDIFLPGFGGLASQLLTVLSGGPEQIEALITGLVDALPAVIDAIAESIPVIIEVLIDKAPEIIEALASATPKIIEALVRKAPDIIETLVRRAPDIALAVVRSIARQVIPLNIDFSKLDDKIGDITEAVGQFFTDLPLIFGEAAQGFFDGVANAGETFVSNIIGGAGRFIGELIEGIKREFGLGGGGGDDRGFGVNNVSIGGLRNSASDLAERAGIPGLGLVGGETARDFQNRRAQNAQTSAEVIERFSESLADSLSANIAELLRGGPTRPLVIQLQVGQAQLANTLLQLNRNGFRTA